MQFDEKWSFVTKKEKHVQPDAPQAPEQGDPWDHVAFDPAHRLVVSVVVGQRTEEHTRLLVEDFHQRTAGRLMDLMTSDELPASATVIPEVYGTVVVPPRTGRPGRPAGPRLELPEDLQDATVHKTREANHVVAVESRVVSGTTASVDEALERSATATSVNTAYIERHNGTDRHRNAQGAEDVPVLEGLDSP